MNWRHYRRAKHPARSNPPIGSHAPAKEVHSYGLTETELSVLGRQCLDRRIPDKACLAQEVAAWQARRNHAEITMDWRFTTADARIKLTHLYPTVQVPAAAQAPSPEADQQPAA